MLTTGKPVSAVSPFALLGFTHLSPGSLNTLFLLNPPQLSFRNKIAPLSNLSQDAALCDLLAKPLEQAIERLPLSAHHTGHTRLTLPISGFIVGPLLSTTLAG